MVIKRSIVFLLSIILSARLIVPINIQADSSLIKKFATFAFGAGLSLGLSNYYFNPQLPYKWNLKCDSDALLRLKNMTQNLSNEDLKHLSEDECKERVKNFEKDWTKEATTLKAVDSNVKNKMLPVCLQAITLAINNRNPLSDIKISSEYAMSDKSPEKILQDQIDGIQGQINNYEEDEARQKKIEDGALTGGILLLLLSSVLFRLAR